jgi:hypothetical protein
MEMFIPVVEGDMEFVAFRIGELLFGFYWMVFCAQVSRPRMVLSVLKYFLLYYYISQQCMLNSNLFCCTSHPVSGILYDLGGGPRKLAYSPPLFGAFPMIWKVNPKASAMCNKISIALL